MVNILLIIVLFIIGTMFGSFGGVLISRERDNKWIKSILFWRSMCDKCKKILSPIELVPILSFVAQKWKCKNCGVKLPNFYRIIELLMWCVFIMTYLLFPHDNLWELVARLAINWWFMLLIIVDYEKYELHFPMWIITTIIALIFAILQSQFGKIMVSTLVFVWVFLWIYFLAKLFVKMKYKVKWEWFGQWDIYLAWTIWILFPLVFTTNDINFNGINIVYLVLFFILISSVIGLIYAGIRYLFTKNKSKELPFIPAMIISYRIIMVFGNYFINMIS